MAKRKSPRRQRCKRIPPYLYSLKLTEDGPQSINGMFWGIGSQSDWDAWSTLFPSWSTVQPYHKKSETFTPPPADQQTQFGMTIQTDAHGYSGPIQTSMSEYIYDPIANWVPTLQAVGMKKGDLQAGDTHVVAMSPSTLNAKNFTRSNSMAGYINPVGPRSNLVILTGMQATSLVWGTKSSSGAVATGVVSVVFDLPSLIYEILSPWVCFSYAEICCLCGCAIVHRQSIERGHPLVCILFSVFRIYAQPTDFP
jgi:hypothetical protein